jgi:hypothetical protein
MSDAAKLADEIRSILNTASIFNGHVKAPTKDLLQRCETAIRSLPREAELRRALERVHGNIADLHGECLVTEGSFDPAKWKIEVAVTDLQIILAALALHEGERGDEPTLVEKYEDAKNLLRQLMQQPVIGDTLYGRLTSFRSKLPWGYELWVRKHLPLLEGGTELSSQPGTNGCESQAAAEEDDVSADALPVFWRGRAQAFRQIDSVRAKSDRASIREAAIYETCADELSTALALRSPPVCGGAMPFEDARSAAIDDSAYYIVQTNGAEWRDFDLAVLKGYMVRRRTENDYVRGRPVWVAKIVRPAAPDTEGR